DFGPNPISSRVEAYRHSVAHVQHQIGNGLAAIAGFKSANAVESSAPELIAINPWNVVSAEVVGANALEGGSTPQVSKPLCLREVPGCGFATFATAGSPPTKPIADGLTLLTERFELTVSKKTGGIQSLRTLRDRNTRASQRLVFHHQTGEEPAQTQMVADQIGVSRNDSVGGEITSHGRVLGPAGDVLVKYTQRVRAIRGIPAVIVD